MELYPGIREEMSRKCLLKMRLREGICPRIKRRLIKGICPRIKRRLREGICPGIIED